MLLELFPLNDFHALTIILQSRVEYELILNEASRLFRYMLNQRIKCRLIERQKCALSKKGGGEFYCVICLKQRTNQVAENYNILLLLLSLLESLT